MACIAWLPVTSQNSHPTILPLFVVCLPGLLLQMLQVAPTSVLYCCLIALPQMAILCSNFTALVRPFLTTLCKIDTHHPCLDLNIPCPPSCCISFHRSYHQPTYYILLYLFICPFLPSCKILEGGNFFCDITEQMVCV